MPAPVAECYFSYLGVIFSISPEIGEGSITALSSENLKDLVATKLTSEYITTGVGPLAPRMHLIEHGAEIGLDDITSISSLRLQIGHNTAGTFDNPIVVSLDES